MQLDKAYEPGLFEPKWTEWRVEEGLFTASTDPVVRQVRNIPPKRKPATTAPAQRSRNGLRRISKRT